MKSIQRGESGEGVELQMRDDKVEVEERHSEVDV